MTDANKARVTYAHSTNEVFTVCLPVKGWIEVEVTASDPITPEQALEAAKAYLAGNGDDARFQFEESDSQFELDEKSE